MIKPEQYLPTLMIAISIGCAIVYIANGDVRKFIYWISAAALNASITF